MRIFRIWRDVLSIGVVVLMIISDSSQGNDTESERLTVQQVLELEKNVRMPEGAMNISEYKRFYSTTRENDRLVILGVYISGSEIGEIKIVEYSQLPLLPFDGGCGVVLAKFDYYSKFLLDIKCSGVA